MRKLPFGLLVLIGINSLCFTALVFIPKEWIGLRTWLVVIPAIIGISFYLHKRYVRGLMVTIELVSTAGVAIAFLIPSLLLSIINLPDSAQHSYGPYLDLLPEVAFAALLGQSFFFIGYSLNMSQRKIIKVLSTPIPLSTCISINTFFKYFFWLIALSWIARISLLSTGTYYHQFRSEFQFKETALASMLFQIANYGSYVIAGVWLQVFIRKSSDVLAKKWLILAICFTSADLIWYLPTGGREPVFVLGIIVFISYLFISRELPIKIFLISSFFSILVVVFMGSYREVIRSTASSASGIKFSEISYSLATAKDQTLDNWESDEWISIASRPSEFRPVAAIIGGVPSSVPYLMGDTYLDIIWIFVPRFIYPDKPMTILPINQWFFQDEGGSSPATLIGEAYLNFGWPGICLVLLIVGWISSLFDIFMWNNINYFSRYSFIWATVYITTATIVFRLYSQSLAIWLIVFLKSILLTYILMFLGKILDRGRIKY